MHPGGQSSAPETRTMPRCSPPWSCPAGAIAPTDSARPVALPLPEQRRLDARELRIDHQRIAHGIESLDKARILKLALKPFHQRLIKTGEEFQHAVDGRRVGDRVRCIDDRLAR